MKRPPTHRIAPLVTIALVAASATLLHRNRGTVAAPHATEVLEARERALQAQVALATQDRLYLLLDPTRGTLALYRGAALLVAWPVSAVEVGGRRVWPGHSREGWWAAPWQGGRLEPPVRRERRVIESDLVEPPDPTGEVEWIPPTPEEEVPTPGRYLIHFAGGLGVEVRAPGADTLPIRPGLGARVQAGLARLYPRNWDRYRIRILMEPAPAGAVYRGLPPDVAFVAIVPGDGA